MTKFSGSTRRNQHCSKANRNRKVLLAASAAAGMLAPLVTVPQAAKATALSWTGATGAAWDGDWTGGATPTSSDDLTILGPSGAAGVLNINVADAGFVEAANTINVTDTAAVTLTKPPVGEIRRLVSQAI